MAPVSRSPDPTPGTWTRSVAMLALAAMTLAACGGGGDGVGTIQLSNDSPDLTPSADDVGSSNSGTNTTDVEFATFDGDTRGLSEYVGRPLVLNFFAAWCGSCIAEMPDLEAVYQEVKDDVAFLGLAQDRFAADALRVVAETGVSYDIGWDPTLDAYLEFDSFQMPTTVFVTSTGEVAEVFRGPLTADAIREKIDAIGN